MKILITVLVGLLLNSSQLCAIATVLFEDPKDPEKNIEVALAFPEGEVNCPLLILLHGWSMAKGAADFKPEVFNYWVNKNVAVAAVSLPGFGQTDGVRDYCGPATMHALNTVIDLLQDRIPVRSVGAMGFGIGGMAALLLTGQRNDLSYAVAAHAVYDLSRLQNPYDPLCKQITGFDFVPDQIVLRSPLTHTATMKTPLFLLHRVPNPFISEEEALIFQDAVLRNGGSCIVKFCETMNKDPRFTHREVVEKSGEWVLQHLFVD
ncbi:MAG: hypothetical protein HYX67_02665 [Candidatus Melainabacteria bacterium]|nr:hypothetical protein [Candidatus Melainabacteria bacterium]